jgi:hypothetical protein
MNRDGPQDLLPLHSFWHGRELPPLAGICLTSFVEMGHSVTLHVFDEPRGVPPGIALADASRTLSREHLFIHRTRRSVAPFADRFRYEILAQNIGAWIDCDLLCLKPLPRDEYIFGWSDAEQVNNAVLMLPADCAVLADLRAMFTARRWVPPWYTRSRQLRYKLKFFMIPSYGHAYMFFGTTGPRALTYFGRRRGILDKAVDRHVFYPVPYDDTAVFLGNPHTVAQFLKPDTLCIHLWNTQLSDLAGGSGPPGDSFLARVLDGTWRAALQQ